jgi:hypothetical protein
MTDVTEQEAPDVALPPTQDELPYDDCRSRDQPSEG